MHAGWERKTAERNRGNTEERGLKEAGERSRDNIGYKRSPDSSLGTSGHRQTDKEEGTRETVKIIRNEKEIQSIEHGVMIPSSDR